MSHLARSSSFRSDIEGLRAVAIILVLGAHFSFAGLSAGFIGVDIFFVISGYLITSILVREYEASGRINLVAFYANRLRRLFPALATMLILSSIALYHIIPATQHATQSAAAASAAFWLSNIYFTFSDTDYFAEENSANAFLHTWSLGVEEQFYLVWPLLIILSIRILAARKSSRPLLAALFLITLASAGACFTLIEKWPAFSFYMMPTRAWQFSAGAITWILTRSKKPGLVLSRSIGLAGALCLISGLFLITPSSSYPGMLALLPTLATCAWLYAGSREDSPTHRILSTSMMQWIGRLSYALYLWHWPVLIIGEHLIPIRGDFSNTVLAIGISLLLAIVTHHMVENPIRFGRPKLIQARWQIGMAIFAMIALNSQLIRWNTTSHEQIEALHDNAYAAATYDMPFFYSDGCDDWYQSDTLKPCVYGNESAEKKAVLLGDSIGAQWFTTLTEMFNPNDWKIIVLTKSSCPIVDEPFFYERIGREYTECSSWRSKAISWLKENNVDILFIGSVASTPFTDEQWTNGTLRIVDQLSEVPYIYLIESNPTLGFHGPNCLLQNQSSAPEKCAQGRADNSGYSHVAKTLEKVTMARVNTHWLEPSSLVCPRGHCSAERDGMIIFRDSQHLTATFTAAAAGHFQRQMHNPMAGITE